MCMGWGGAGGGAGSTCLHCEGLRASGPRCACLRALPVLGPQPDPKMPLLTSLASLKLPVPGAAGDSSWSQAVSFTPVRRSSVMSVMNALHAGESLRVSRRACACPLLLMAVCWTRRLGGQCSRLFQSLSLSTQGIDTTLPP